MGGFFSKKRLGEPYYQEQLGGAVDAVWPSNTSVPDYTALRSSAGYVGSGRDRWLSSSEVRTSALGSMSLFAKGMDVDMRTEDIVRALADRNARGIEGRPLITNVREIASDYSQRVDWRPSPYSAQAVNDNIRAMAGRPELKDIRALESALMAMDMAALANARAHAHPMANPVADLNPQMVTLPEAIRAATIGNSRIDPEIVAKNPQWGESTSWFDNRLPAPAAAVAAGAPKNPGQRAQPWFMQ